MSAEMHDPDWTLPRRFWLVRRHSHEIVAEGVVWSGGQVALHWPGRLASEGQWASLDDMLTRDGCAVALEWVDEGDDLHGECVEYYDGAIWIH